METYGFASKSPAAPMGTYGFALKSPPRPEA